MSGIRNLILSSKYPIVFQGKVAEWDMLKWNEEEWCNLFGDEPVPFRCGPKKCTPVPQWERTCKTVNMTMSEFFESARNDNSDSWKYFDYKHLNQPWLKNSESLKTLSWANFGFPEVSKDESTLWIGSVGAHTPCHMDSYGCNLVAQIRGHKQWILFPPSESINLNVMRVPYEESSVYSAHNFYAPIGNISDSLDNVYIVTLSPGDVLLVPHHWWHYVENLDTAIAINAWLPLPEDDDSRVDECLVRFFISQASSNLPRELFSKILNPNEDDLNVMELSSAMTLMKFCLESVSKASDLSRDTRGVSANNSNNCEDSFNLLDVLNDDSDRHPQEDSKRRKMSSMGIPDMSLCSSSSGVNKRVLADFKLLPKSSISDLKNILNAKCKCGSEEEHAQVMNSNVNPDDPMDLLPAVLNSFCHPEVLKIVKKLLLKQTCNKEY